MDLLRVSWINKAFRNVLARKSSRRVWMATFDNLPKAQRPPPCPEDLTEIAYADLLYDPFVWCVRVFIFCFAWLNRKTRIAGSGELERIGWLV